MKRGGHGARLRQAILGLKREHGREIMARHGAHALGLGRGEGGADDDLALLVYVEPGSTPPVPVPESMQCTPPGGGAPVRVPLRLVELPRATRE